MVVTKMPTAFGPNHQQPPIGMNVSHDIVCTSRNNTTFGRSMTRGFGSLADVGGTVGTKQEQM